MVKKVVKANPTKEFFVNMLIRDILLKEAIIELIDNSIDGAKSIKDDNYNGLSIKVNFDNSKFVITDNCGGIPLDIAANYAFRFGRSKLRENTEKETTGIFGIGMKRALFKIGNLFTIESKTKTTSFKITLDVEKWVSEDNDNWDFSFDWYNEKEDNTETGTKIEVTNLNREVSYEFESPYFEKEVIEHIQRRVGLDISNGIDISVNDNDLIGNNIMLIDNEEIKPIKEEFTKDNVDVRIIAGIAPRIGPKYLPENAGWYIYCNGRLIVAADKTSLTTWKDLENKASGVIFHNDYAGFRGIVYFNSKKPEKLPWNTMKTGIDESSILYLETKEKMLEIFKILKPVFEELKATTREDNDGIEETIAKMSGTEATIENVKNIAINRQIDIHKVTVVTEPKVNISYKKLKKDADLLKDALGVKSYKEVGEHTFEYYKDAEC